MNRPVQARSSSASRFRSSSVALPSATFAANPSTVSPLPLALIVLMQVYALHYRSGQPPCWHAL
ncbi:MAG TPA: hypothetical protein PLE35_05385, partial [Lentisphaeria bacterium]|nr:hypothetical protein [Lentisphaeria bacterium]